MATMPETVRRSLQSLMTDYSHTIDVMEDVDRVVGLFTDDAVLDFSSVGFPTMRGSGEIRDFYSGLFSSMQAEFHDMANFRPASWDGEVGVMECYVMGMGQPRDGDGINVKVKYRWECVETGDGWKCRNFSLLPMMPVG